ncbi:MAG TPA: protein kinase [Gemmatimonadaceae bacterium]|nr:protein kinase [Gemmatimonadaceae bacterium]
MTDPLRTALSTALGPSFTLGDELRGGMARIFVATDTALARRVVVKTLAEDPLDGAQADRFRREILLAAGLQHPNVVPVLSVGATSDGVPYYVMPFVEGQTLRHRLARGAIPPHEVVAVLRDVLRALAAAHRKGIIHRDIKPENIFLSDGVAMLSDFGIAKALDAVFPARVTATGVAVGTPAYMSPEQVAAETTVGARTDLYSLGVVAWELLAGRHPYEGRSATAMLAAHLTEPLPPIGSVVPGLPEGLARTVDALVEKDPARRPTDAEAVMAELSTLVTPTGSISPRRSTDDRVPAGGSARGAAPTPPAARRRLPLVPLAVALGVVLLAALGVRAWRRAETPVTRAGDDPWAGFAWVWPISEVRVAAADTLAQSLVQEAATRERAVRVVSLEAPQAPDSLSMVVRSLGRTVVMERLGQAPLTVLSLTLPRDELVGRIAGVFTLLSTDALGEWMLPKGLPPTFDEVQRFIGIERSWTSQTGLDSAERARLPRELDAFVAEVPRWPAAVLLMANRLYVTAWTGRDRAVEAIAARRRELTAAESALLDVVIARIQADAPRYLSALREFVANTHSRELGRAMSLALIDARNLKEAEQLVLSAGPRPRQEHLNYWNIVTRLQHILGKYDAELATSDRAMQRSSARVSVRADRLRALLALGRRDSVDAGVRELPGLPVDPQLSPGWAMKTLADEAHVHGRAAEAPAILSKAAEWYRVETRNDPDGQASLEYAQLLLALGDTTAGVAIADSIVRARPGARTPLAVRAILAARTGDTRTADALFARWRTLPAPTAPADIVLEDWRAQRGSIPGTTPMFEARLAALRGDTARAVSIIRRALDFDGWREWVMLLHADPDFVSVRELPEVRALIGVP